jgi:hypothetical protein
MVDAYLGANRGTTKLKRSKRRSFPTLSSKTEPKQSCAGALSPLKRRCLFLRRRNIWRQDSLVKLLLVQENNPSAGHCRCPKGDNCVWAVSVGFVGIFFVVLGILATFFHRRRTKGN